MTLTPEQLSAVERQMEEEYRKDREALARLKRFLKVDAPSENIDGNQSNDSTDVSDAAVPTIIGKVEEIMTADITRKWTVPTMLAHLRHEKFPLTAQKPEATLGQVFAKLQRRGVIRIVRRGSGRIPNVFKAVPQITKEEATPETSKSERATEGQPVAIH